MHIQSGVLDPVTLGLTGAAALGAVTYAGWTMRHARPRLGLALACAGGVVVAHVLDVPLGAGGALTGHVIGGALLAIGLGPALGLVVMASVLAFEAVALGDGAAAALGANTLVMGIAGVLVGWAVWRWLSGLGDRWRVPAAGLAGFASVAASSLVLWAVYAAGAPSLVGVTLWHHAARAVLEGAVTAGVVALALAWSAFRSRARDHSDALGVGHRHVHVIDGDLEVLG